MSMPPSVGAATIGMRFSTDWTVKPMARWREGRASPMMEKSVGEAMLDQAIAKSRPRKIQGHVGASQ